MTTDEKFMLDLSEMPYLIISKAEFEDGKVLITFNSGNQLCATAPNEKVYNDLKEEFIKNLGTEKVVIK